MVAVAVAARVRLTHVSSGALYNHAALDAALRGLARGVRCGPTAIVWLAVPALAPPSPRTAGLARAFVDRGYDPDVSLGPSRLPGAVHRIGCRPCAALTCW